MTGCVTQAGEQGANIGRLAVLLAGFPVEVPAVTLNRMCGSGQQAIHFAAQQIAAGDAAYTIGGGVEHMTRAPMFSDVGTLDKMNPELFETLRPDPSGRKRRAAGREVQDHAQRRRRASRWRAIAAPRRAPAKRRTRRSCRPRASTPRATKSRSTRDEGIRDKIDPAKMASLPTVFRPDGNGVVTAANSSQISDGAAAVLIGGSRSGR